jgi:hypothetical protein
MTTKPAEIGSVNTDPSVRRRYAKQSVLFNCKQCGLSHPELLTTSASYSSVSATTTRNYFGKNELTLKNLQSSGVTRKKASLEVSPLRKQPLKSSFLATIFKSSFLKTVLLSFPLFLFLCTKIIDCQFSLRDTY